MKVRDVMRPEVATVRPDAPLKDVARLLAQCRAGVVYVVDKRGAPVGMVSDSELFLRERRLGFAMKLHSLFGELVNLDHLPDHYEAAHHRKARDMMTRCVPSVDAESDFRRLVELMIDNHLARVVVLEQNKVAGIVTRTDLISRMLKVN